MNRIKAATILSLGAGMKQRNRGSGNQGKASWRLACAGLCMAMLASCSSLGGSGPSSRDIRSAGNSSVANADIKIIEVTDSVARQVLAAQRAAMFSETLGDAPRIGSTIGRG